MSGIAGEGMESSGVAGECMTPEWFLQCKMSHGADPDGVIVHPPEGSVCEVVPI